MHRIATLFALALTCAFALDGAEVGLGPLPAKSSFPAPGPIGATTPSTGAFTSLSATGDATLSGSTSSPLTVNGMVGSKPVVLLASTASDIAGIKMTVPTIGDMTIGMRSANSFVINNGSNFAGTDIFTAAHGGLISTFGAFTAGGVLTGSSATDATSATAAGTILSGGLGVAKNVIGAQGFALGVTSTATAAGTTALTSTSRAIEIFTGSSTQTVTLPAANAIAANSAQFLFIKNLSSGTVTVNRAGSDALEGGTTLALTGGSKIGITLVSDGSAQWVIVGRVN